MIICSDSSGVHGQGVLQKEGFREWRAERRAASDSEDSLRKIEEGHIEEYEEQGSWPSNDEAPIETGNLPS